MRSRPRYRRHLLARPARQARPARADGADDADDAALADDWLALLHAGRVDFTLAWRRLADAADGDDAPLRALFAGAGGARRLARALARALRARGRARRGEARRAARAERMRRVNPWIIPRNHRVEEALAAASDDDDLGPFDRLLDAVRRPFDETRRQRPLCRAGRRRGHRGLPHVLRHLICASSAGQRR